MSNITERVKRYHAWIVVNLGERVDSFNFNEIKSYFDSQIFPGSLVAIDVKHTRFLSLAAYKYLAELGAQLQNAKGCLAMLGASEKLKHQMGLFSSLDKILIVKYLEQLPQVGSADLSPPPDETLGS